MLDENELISLKARLDRLKVEVFGEYKSKTDTNRKFYDLDFGVDIVPEKWAASIKPFIPETAARAIDEPANHILDYPHIKVATRPTEADDESEKVIAAVKRIFLNSWWSNVIRTANPIGDGKRPYLNEGRICVRKTINWDVVPDKPERDGYPSDEAHSAARSKYRRDVTRMGEVEFPWIVEVLDNCTVYEDPSSHRDPAYVYLEYTVMCGEALRRFPEAKGQWKEWSEFENVTYVECWTKPKLNPDGTMKERGYFVQWVGDEVVHNDDNPYWYIPIIIEDNGFGTLHSLAKPHQKYRGMTEKAHPTFIAEAKQLTAWQAVNEISAFPMGELRNSSKTSIQVGPGFIIPMEGAKGSADGESLEWLSHPDVPQGVIALFQTTQKLASDTYKFGTLGGVAQSGVDTATEADQNVRNASAILSSPVSGLNRLCERLSRQVLMDVELTFEAPVTVRGVGEGDPAEIKLFPDDIKGFYDVRAELRTSDDDAIAINKARFWIEMALRAPFLSYETAMLRGEITDDPVTERLRRAAEDVFLSDAFKAIRVQTGAQSYGQFAQMMANKQMQDASMMGSGAPGVNQGNTMTQMTPSGVPQDDIFAQSLVDRDTNQGGAALRG